MTRSSHAALIAATLLAAGGLASCDQPPPETRPHNVSAAASPQPASEPPPPASPTPTTDNSQAPPTAAELDSLADPVSECSRKEVTRATADLIEMGSGDPLPVCRRLETWVGVPPQVQLLRSMLVTTSLYARRDRPAAQARVMGQLLELAHLRGLSTPEGLMRTLSLVRRMMMKTGGQAGPTELIAFLRASGPMAKTLSDEGILNLAWMISGESPGAPGAQ